MDVFGDPESVVDQEKHAGKYVPNQRLRAKADRKTEHASTGEKQREIDPQFGKRDHAGNDDDDDQQKVTEQRQQDRQPGCAGVAAFFAGGSGRITALRLDLPVYGYIDGLEGQPGEENNQHDLPYRVGDAAGLR